MAEDVIVRIPAGTARVLVDHGLLVERRLRAAACHELSRRALDVLRAAACGPVRSEYGERIDAYRVQHMDIRHRRTVAGGRRHEVLVDLRESPIWHLRRIKRRDGRPYFTERDMQAAQHLRDDFERGALGGARSVDYRRIRVDGGAREPALTDAQLAARQRLMAALDAAPEETRDVLWRVCCAGETMMQAAKHAMVERRATRMLLKIGLGAVAAYYGIT